MRLTEAPWADYPRGTEQRVDWSEDDGTWAEWIVRSEDTGWLAAHRYIASDSVSLADFAAYVEIGQLRPGFTNVYDFADFPNVSRWLDDMATVDGHDDVHVVLSEIGDISQEAPSMDTIRSANKRALSVLKSRLSNLP